MCTLLDAFEKEGMEKGIAQGEKSGEKRGEKKGRYHSLDELMKNTTMSVSEAMNALGFSDEEKSGYKQWKSDNKTTT